MSRQGGLDPCLHCLIRQRGRDQAASSSTSNTPRSAPVRHAQIRHTGRSSMARPAAARDCPGPAGFQLTSLPGTGRP